MILRKMSVLFAAVILAAGALSMSGCNSSNATTEGATTSTAAQDLVSMKAGNTDFLANIFTKLAGKSTAAVRTDLATNGQHPVTIVLTCADSRVPPEIIFNKGLGELFVIRVAGNIVGAYELASIEYGVEHLGAKQIVVLGHSKCGAVKEAFNNYSATHNFRSLAGKPGFSNLSSLVNAIRPAVTAAAVHNTNATLWEAAIDENVKLVKEQLISRSTILKEKIEEAKEVTLIGAKYDISAGTVGWDL